MTDLANLPYLPYSDDVETIEPDEPETFARIVEAMGQGGALTRKRLGFSVRTSHAKAHGLVKGELRVQQNLPPHLRQGLFTESRAFPVIARLAHVPGDLDDDRKVSGPRGLSLKILEVTGQMLPGHSEHATQDWILDTGKVFNAIGAKTFLAQIAPVQRLAPRLPQPVKGTVTAASLAGNQALHAVGMHSAALDFFGHPFVHPLGETYYSQVPIRFGRYIAKLRVAPSTPGLRALLKEPFQPGDYDGLRTATVAFFRRNPAIFELSVQLCTGLTAMPVENANAEWPEDQSPFQPVAQISFPAQESYSPARSEFVENRMLFCPSHSLAAHRPLGSLMRARMYAYDRLGAQRLAENNRTRHEPRSLDEIPD